jgi:hypothetical protein
MELTRAVDGLWVLAGRVAVTKLTTVVMAVTTVVEWWLRAL